MPAIHHASSRLRARDSSSDDSNPLTQKLLIVLVVLVFAAITLIGALFLVRMQRRSKQLQNQTDLEKSKRLSTSSHRLTITTSNGKHESMLVYQEKAALMAECSGPPSPSVPEIHITFPEETDEAGKRKSGRVVVVRMGESSIGMEPVHDAPPAYEQGAQGRFQSLDLDRIGGLKETR